MVSETTISVLLLEQSNYPQRSHAQAKMNALSMDKVVDIKPRETDVADSV